MGCLPTGRARDSAHGICRMAWAPRTEPVHCIGGGGGEGGLGLPFKLRGDGAGEEGSPTVLWSQRVPLPLFNMGVSKESARQHFYRAHRIYSRI